MAGMKDIQEELGAMLNLDRTELSEEQQAELDAYIAELCQARADKADRFAQFCRLSAERVKAIRAEARALDRKAASLEANLAWLKNHYMQIMETAGLTNLAGNAYTLSVRQTDSVNCYDIGELAAIEPDLVREEVKRSPMKDEIKRLLKAGTSVPGCELVHGASLVIR